MLYSWLQVAFYFRVLCETERDSESDSESESESDSEPVNGESDSDYEDATPVRNKNTHTNPYSRYTRKQLIQLLDDRYVKSNTTDTKDILVQKLLDQDVGDERERRAIEEEDAEHLHGTFRQLDGSLVTHDSTGRHVTQTKPAYP